MKREINFRGLYKDMFVYGNLIQANFNGKPFTEIEYSDSNDFHKWEVDPNTVGQYTGLKDRDGVEIYEGDIVAAKHRSKGNVQIGSIEMPKSCWVLQTKNDLGKIRWFRTAEFSQLEIIGNIHQHPELLKP